MDNEELEGNISSQNGNDRVLSITTKETPRDMCKVICSGGFFLIPLHLCDELQLFDGMFLSEEARTILHFQNNLYYAYRKAKDLLYRTDHSEEMVRRKLRQRQYPEDVIQSVVEQLREEGIINDRNFGEHYVQFLVRKNKYGKRMLQAKLREKGISRELTEELLNSVSENMEESALKASVEKLFEKKKMTDEKMVRSLVRKGFPVSKVYTFIKKMEK